jgi:hypothetical protein
MTVAETVAVVLGGGAVGVVAAAVGLTIRNVYATKRAKDLDERKLDARVHTRAEDTTARHLVRREAQHEKCLDQVESLQREVTRVSVAQAVCQGENAARVSEIAELRFTVRRLMRVTGLIDDMDEGTPAE